MITLAMHHEGAKAPLTDVLFVANLVFTAIFALEAALKMCAMGPKLYFQQSRWNVFDFAVVVCSLLEILVLYFLVASELSILRVAPQIIRIFRVLRVTRIIRLINKSKGGTPAV